MQKSTIVFLLIMLIYIQAKTQAGSRLGIAVGVNTSNFEFVNSEGTLQDGYKSSTSTLFGAQLNRFYRRHVGRIGLTVREGGASYSTSGTSVSWTTNYLTFNVGYMMNVVNKPRLKVYPGITYYGGYMVNGKQTIGERVLSLNDGRSLKKLDHGLEPLLGLSYGISENINFCFEYSYGLGLAQLEKNTMNQKTYNRYSSVVLGLGFVLNKKEQ